MRPIHLRWLVISSLALALTAQAATRPHYGGTLRLETHAAISSLDPLQKMNFSDAGVRDELAPLLFDTLVRMDANGTPQPQLATRWQSDPGNKRWQFWFRRGVVMQDGSALTPPVVAQSLSLSLAGFSVRVVGESVVVESADLIPGMLALLSLPQNAIAVRGNGTIVGSGPFRVAEFQPGRRLVLQANEEYWNGRPYLDSVEITLAQSLRDQAMHLQLGRADVVELAPDQVRRSMQEKVRVSTSSPSDLIAIVVPHGLGAAEDPRMREALSLAIDRATIQNVLLQRQGDPSASVLPQWISGYSVLFPTATNVVRARQLRSDLGNNQPAVQLAYDPMDPIARMVAERVAVNARDAGIFVQTAPATTVSQSSPRVVRISLNSGNPQAALVQAAVALDPAQLAKIMGAKSPEELYQAERGLLEDYRVIPIAHVSESFALSQRVHDWMMQREGGLPLDNVWVEVGQ